MGLFRKTKKTKQVSAKDSLREMKQATARFEFSQEQQPKDWSMKTPPKKTYNYQSEKPGAYRTTEDRVWDFLFTKDKDE